MAAGGKNKSLEDALVKEDKLAPVLSVSRQSNATSDVQTIAAPVIQQPIMLVIAERICAKLSRDGMVNSFEIKGLLELTATNDDAALCSVQLAVGDVDSFIFQTHPKINKQLYDKSGLLQLKDTTKGFPSQRPVGILKWTHASTSDDMIPIKINCWPEEAARGQMNVSIEYSMDQRNLVLDDVRIRIPLGTHESPNIVAVDGSYKHNSQAHELIWIIDSIDANNSTGSLEFNVSQKNSDAFFPVTVQFRSSQLFCNVEVQTVVKADSNLPIQYSLSKSMSAEEYVVE